MPPKAKKRKGGVQQQPPPPPQYPAQLPDHLVRLMRVYSSLDTLVSLQTSLKTRTVWSTLRPLLNASARVAPPVGAADLGRIKHLVPELLFYRKASSEDPKTLKQRDDLVVEIHRGLGKKGKVSHKTATKEIPKRTALFRQRCSEYVDRAQTQFLRQQFQDGGDDMDDDDNDDEQHDPATSWHPSFDLALVPVPPVEDLPVPLEQLQFDDTGARIDPVDEDDDGGDEIVDAQRAADAWQHVLPLAPPDKIYEHRTVPEMLAYLRAHAFYADQIAYVHTMPPRSAEFRDLDSPLSELTRDALAQSGITRLYSHQAVAINHIQNGHNVVVAASTSSGKSLIYNVPVLEAIQSDFSARAIYIFPTKALAQDQLRALRELFPHAGNSFATYDGDTEKNTRRDLRGDLRVLMTNPDMLHVGILPNHKLWAETLANLKYVVLDEIHTYRGVFGSHVALILRRLRRVCAKYGASPQFVMCSATIHNPLQHGQRLAGVPAVLVDEDGSPRGTRTYVLWNPPLIDAEKGKRRSTHLEGTHLFVELLKHGYRTLVFASSRNVTELVLDYSLKRIRAEKSDLVGKIESYRAGYMAGDRRLTEKALFRGELMGVVTTSALELGVDIGTLDSTIAVGFPTSIASMWQQSGRCGRGQRDSLSFVVAYGTPLDQFYMRNPAGLFDKPSEAAIIDPENPFLLGLHLPCAAREAPLELTDAEDRAMFGAAIDDAVTALVDSGQLALANNSYGYTRDDYPAVLFGIRSMSPKRYKVIHLLTGEEIEEVEADVAFLRLYPGAILLNRGETLEVVDLNQEALRATAKPVRVRYYTKPRDITTVSPTRCEARRMLNVDRRTWTAAEEMDDWNPQLHADDPRNALCRLGRGHVSVKIDFLGYWKVRQVTGRMMEKVDHTLPSTVFATKGLWIDIADELKKEINENPQMSLVDGLHAVGHALAAVLPVFILSDAHDINVVCIGDKRDEKFKKGDRLQFYDGCEGGDGMSRRAFDLFPQLVENAYQLVANCACSQDTGCPACLHSGKCTKYNEYLDKRAAVRILRYMTGRE